MAELNLPIPHEFKARPYQYDFFEAMKSGKKRALLIWPRRNGKDKCCWNYLIMKAIQKVGIYYYIFPTYSQGRKILWDGIDKQGFKVMDHLPKEIIRGNPNNTEMKIWLKNNSLIQIIGSDSCDSIVGTNPIGCIFSEYSLQDPKAWQLIRPILAENEGWAVFCATPRGQNHLKDMYDMAIKNDAWFCSKLTANDTGFPSKEEIQVERDAGMSEDFIEQEFFTSFVLGVEGSYYARYMQQARDEDRIGKVAWQRQSRVYTAWDIGYGDSCAIIFYQVIGSEIHIIDYYENNGEGLPHYAKVLFDKPYLYADHFAPHDIDSHAFSSGLSAKEVGAGLGIKFLTLPTLKLTIEDGIEALRGIFPRILIDEVKCKQLIKCLENYRKEFDQKHNIYKSRPLHDWSSHGCFIGETLIDCLNEKKRIDEVKKGDLVLTPNGYKKVLKTFCYESQNLLEITTTNSKFICTGNHKIFSNEGLVHADALRYNTTLYTNNWWSKFKCRMKYGLTFMERSIGFRENFLSVKMKCKLSLMDINLDGMETIIEEEVLPSIQIPLYKDASGLCIMEQFPKECMCITKMKILKIIKSKILNLFLFPNICHFILPCQKEKKSLENGYTKLWNMQKFGMQVQLESNGIKNMQKIVDLENSAFQRFVSFAKKIIWPKCIIKNTAQMDVKQKLDINQELITKKENVKSVKKYLSVINMLSKERVLNVAPLNLQTTQKVYDFEVETDHCYYANGILVSNSDAARYLAIAVKRFVDAKDGPDDDEVERLKDKYQPVFK